MRRACLFNVRSHPPGRGFRRVGLTALCCALLAATVSVLGADAYTIGGRVIPAVEGPEADIWYETSVMLFSLPDSKIIVTTAPDDSGQFAFGDLEPGDYMVQVVAPNHIVSKTRVTVGMGHEDASQQLEIVLLRPIDPGIGGVVDPLGLIDGAGIDHAFGCVSISLIFVQFQGSSTWTAAQINTATTAAQTSMNSFAAIAPPGAHVTTTVEDFGTYTVTNPVGCWCADADLWVDEVLQQAGYTTGSLDARIADLSNDRRDALCGTDPLCDGCGADASNFLFFITRDDCALWGGWNCTGRYLISYWNRYDDSVVYIHEVGHGFGANDEYCVPNQDYCCGWFLTSTWGCDKTGGCLSGTNDNCDPACGVDCGGVDCQDGCPNANCTTHTACAMDGSNTLTFCQATRRQIGWVDSDGDDALDCLESACGTDPGDDTSIPICVAPPEADANGPYGAECAGATTSLQLDGTGSSDPDPDDTLTFSWSTDCPGGVFDDATDPAPVLTVNTSAGCNIECSVFLTVTDTLGNTDTDNSTVTVIDTTPPGIACPADVTIECDDSADPSNTGVAVSSDVCDPDPTESFASLVTPGSCPQEWTITRTWTATDDCGNTSSCVQTIEVEDTTPPELSFELTPDVLWPPNHKFWTVQADITVTDNCDGDPAVTLVSISSNESDNANGDGNTNGDIQDADIGTDDREFRLRAERQGGGDGRIYTVTYAAEDGCGNRTETSAEVRVPHDQSGHALTWSGIATDGATLDPLATQWALVVPSSAEFDAVGIDTARAYVGNFTGVQTPVDVVVVDFQQDGLFDLVLVYDAERTRELLSLSNRALGLHYQATDGTDYAILDVFELLPAPRPEATLPEATADDRIRSTNPDVVADPQ